MRNLDARLKRMEKALGVGQAGDKHLVVVYPKPEEKPEKALKRECRRRKIRLADVGHVIYIGDTLEETDHRNHNGLRTLQGYPEFIAEVKRMLKAIDGQTLGPTGVNT